MGKFKIRALRTPLVERMLIGEQPTDRSFAADAVEASWIWGNLEAGVLPAGEIAGLIPEIPSVKEIIEEMVRGR